MVAVAVRRRDRRPLGSTQFEFLSTVVGLLDAAGIPHTLARSMASTFHGEPRMTRDIDMVIHPTPESMERFVGSLDRSRYGIDDAAHAVRRRDMRKVIDIESGWKVDLIIRNDRAFSLEESRRRQPAVIGGVALFVATTGDETFDLPASRDGIDILEDVDGSIEVKSHAQHDEGEPEWIRDLGMMCRTLRIFERAATAAGADLTPTTFQVGVDGIGEFELPFSLFASLGPGKWDASDELRLSEFDPQAGELGGATPYGPLVRID